MLCASKVLINKIYVIGSCWKYFCVLSDSIAKSYWFAWIYQTSVLNHFKPVCTRLVPEYQVDIQGPVFQLLVLNQRFRDSISEQAYRLKEPGVLILKYPEFNELHSFASYCKTFSCYSPLYEKSWIVHFGLQRNLILRISVILNNQQQFYTFFSNNYKNSFLLIC